MLTDEWRKSSRSGGQGGNCAKARLGRTGVQVGDTKLGENSPVLEVSPDDWKATLRLLRD